MFYLGIVYVCACTHTNTTSGASHQVGSSGLAASPFSHLAISPALPLPSLFLPLPSPLFPLFLFFL